MTATCSRCRRVVRAKDDGPIAALVRHWQCMHPEALGPELATAPGYAPPLIRRMNQQLYDDQQAMAAELAEVRVCLT